jgi:hypothetical protein
MSSCSCCDTRTRSWRRQLQGRRRWDAADRLWLAAPSRLCPAAGGQRSSRSPRRRCCAGIVARSGRPPHSGLPSARHRRRQGSAPCKPWLTPAAWGPLPHQPARRCTAEPGVRPARLTGRPRHPSGSSTLADFLQLTSAPSRHRSTRPLHPLPVPIADPDKIAASTYEDAYDSAASFTSTNVPPELVGSGVGRRKALKERGRPHPAPSGSARRAAEPGGAG